MNAIPKYNTPKIRRGEAQLWKEKDQMCGKAQRNETETYQETKKKIALERARRQLRESYVVSE